MLLTEIGDVAGAGFEDPQAEQAQHGDEREVVSVGGGACSGSHRLELQMGQAKRRRFGRNAGSTDVFRWRVLQYGVDDAGAVQADHYRQPP